MFEGEVATRLVERLRLSRWLRRFPPRLVRAAFVFANGFLAVAILAGLATPGGDDEPSPLPANPPKRHESP